jgi:UDP-3-O-[3-hydroxymyristoyl] N-acetylglucosamine deacetylase/3-hydroxyacyl-[acyl-carrier-protein] dehydratase
MHQKHGIALMRNIYLQDEKKRVDMVAMPAPDYSVTTLIDFNSPVLGRSMQV